MPIAYTKSSRECLVRATNQLDLYDRGIIESLFYAAFELRFGIEARLFEYIEATLRSQKKPRGKIKEYSASKLLRVLSEADEWAAEEAILVVEIEGNPQKDMFRFIPVSKTLASYHGILGGFLHFNFFHNNPDWYHGESTKDKTGTLSLIDVRAFLATVAEELAKVTEGNLLLHPRFSAFIETNK